MNNNNMSAPLVKQLLSKIDSGPKETFMDRLRIRASPTKAEPSDMLKTWLPFAQKLEHQEKLSKLAALIPHLKNLPRSYTTAAIVSWIHSTNKIEHEGMKTEAETHQVIQEYLQDDIAPHAVELKKKSVLHSLKLLQTTYNPEVLDTDCPQNYIAFDKEKLLLFHTTLFVDLLPSSGSFRTSGASTKVSNGNEFKYPHHELISSALDTLGHVTYRLITSFVHASDETQRVGYCFALAAFVQFHFVSVHPFEDGNERICRYLIKRILDWVFPFPFPMFQNREDYLKTLTDARSPEVDIAYSPEPLMELLMDAALNYYENLLPSVQEIFIVAESEHQLEMKLKSYLVAGNDRQEMLRHYRALAEGAVITVTLAHMKVSLKKFSPLILIDSI